MKSNKILPIVIALLVILGLGLFLSATSSSAGGGSTDGSNTENTSTSTTGNSSKPSTSITKEERYANFNILSEENVEGSNKTLSSAEAITFLNDRGFKEIDVYSSFTEKGEHFTEEKQSAGSNTKHPVYSLTYDSATGESWAIYLCAGKIYAMPINYSVNKNVQLFLSETDTIVSYDKGSNQYVEVKSSASTTKIKKIDHIDANTLDSLTNEKIGEL